MWYDGAWLIIRDRLNEFGRILFSLTREQCYPLALATLIRVSGSSYRRTGARLLIDAAGRKDGSISGGCLEEDLLARMAPDRATPDGRTIVTYDTTSENDLVWGVGLGCHGVVDILLEWFQQPPPWVGAVQERWSRRQPLTLWIGAEGTRFPDAARAVPPPGVFVNSIQPPLALNVFGAGDDAQPLVQLATRLGWTVTVLDPRPAFATAGRFPQASAVASAPVDDLVTRASWDDRTAAVVMTHHYNFDRPLLEKLLHLNLPYLGLLGPRRRADRILADFVPPLPFSGKGAEVRLHAPIGLDLGGDGPEAVALAILAEIQAVMTRRDAQPLRRRRSPIHAD